MSSPSLPTISLFTFAGLVILLACTFQSITPQTAQSIFVDGPGAPDADALIIGGSHAGLSGALTLVRHQHHIIVFDDGRPRNKWDTPMHVQPTWENQTPNQLRKASRQELRKSGLVKFVDEKIVKIDKHHDSLFYVTGSSGAQWSGRKLMLTPGVELVYPDIDGYTENFPDKM
jgi:thioredoxin reductase